MGNFGRFSVFNAEYLGREFQVPIYPWSVLEPFWPDIALGISKVLVYNKFSRNCARDHHAWSRMEMGLEALRFADLLSRDRGVRFAVKNFNSQAELKWGEWLEPFDKDTPFWVQQLTQFGALIHNSVTFLRKAGYLRVYPIDLGVEIMRPYWAPTSKVALKKLWLEKTFRFIIQHYRENKRYPSLREIASFWRVPRYVLIESDVTRDLLYEMFRFWKKYGTVKLLKPRREYKLVNEEEQISLAREIAKRVA